MGAKHCCPFEPIWSVVFFFLVSVSHVGKCDDGADKFSSAKALEAMRKATEFMTTQVAVHGGYVYDVTLDLKVRRGEGIATATEVWVQPPGTPAVGLAFIKAYDATGEQLFLDAATQCAHYYTDNSNQAVGLIASILIPMGKTLVAIARTREIEQAEITQLSTMTNLKRHCVA